ncbi:MAG: peptide-methionine (R)-S-oxide reductase [Planctomycetes bacterium]|jgi:peptide-methionine (R)-S-oxide reductase|nr:peptide-methionine (R)-S-oxide reductase [Planctomycetota bacterium]
MIPDPDPPKYDDAGRLVKLARSDEEWKRILTPEQVRICRKGGTEAPDKSAFHRHAEEGLYSCVACSLPLYSSKAKFEHCAGWPSFREAVDPRHVEYRGRSGRSLDGAEAVCGRCGSHLGHLFLDGPPPARTRH